MLCHVSLVPTLRAIEIGWPLPLPLVVIVGSVEDPVDEPAALASICAGDGVADAAAAKKAKAPAFFIVAWES
jgi:phosphoglycolate phosphatase-like HAD superfamily hydrolase